MTDRAATLLTELAGDDAVLRADQARAIEALVTDRERVLVVQRTGWGKSAVYFIATRLLRDAGAGPTLLVSPLLALMRDQLAAAQRIGLHAETINSTNREAWDEIAARVRAGAVDLLLVSPERLNHPRFRRDVLAPLAAAIGMLVVDEAHCISDWGHDFRPDYRRIADLLAVLPADVPVLATTATANERVSADVAAQLGAEPVTLRGSLDRTSLALAVVGLASTAQRMAWLAEWIPTTAGAGIVYCLTIGDAERLARFLASRGIDAIAYSGRTDPAEREGIEARLSANDVKVVCATSALGMGYDKPDLAFVAHFGSPDSPIAYYQAVGRAGRALDHADAVLLPGTTDEAIWDYFARTSLPSVAEADELLAALDDAVGAAGGPVSAATLEPRVNLRRSRIDQVLKVLDVDGAVDRGDAGWTSTGSGWTPDPQRIARVRQARIDEAQAMRDYAATSRCRMAFLRDQLDDDAPDCGRCDVCTGRTPGPVRVDAELVAAAQQALRAETSELEPRKRWPAGVVERSGAIPAGERAEPGRALALGTDHGWHEVFAAVLDAADPSAEAAFDTLIQGVTELLAEWSWDERPTWITWVPSRRREPLLAALADRLGALGRLPVHRVLVGAEDTPPQRTLRNSAQQASAALRRLDVDAAALATAPSGAVLLLDDTAHSRWTVTAAAALLRGAGSGPVLPLVLHHLP